VKGAIYLMKTLKMLTSI